MNEFGLDAYYLKEGFSSWKGNLSTGKTGKHITAEELESNLDEKFLLDVRDSDEFSEYRIPGSVNIPLKDLFKPKILEKIPHDKEIVTICPHGSRAMIAGFAFSEDQIRRASAIAKKHRKSSRLPVDLRILEFI